MTDAHMLDQCLMYEVTLRHVQNKFKLMLGVLFSSLIFGHDNYFVQVSLSADFLFVNLSAHEKLRELSQ